MEAQNSDFEKRNSPRRRIEIPLTVKLTGSSLPDLKAKTYDLSSTGIRLSLEDKIELPGNAVLEFELPSLGHKVKTYSELVWNNGRFYGMRFKNQLPG